MRASPLLLLVAAACGGGSPDVTVAPECNPLGFEGAGCMLPWPSSAFLAEDGDTPTGLRVDLPAESMPVNIDDIVVDAAPWGAYDGFSPSGAIVAAFPGGVSGVGLPGHEDPEASLMADASVMLVDVERGEKVLMFAETDMNEAPEFRTLIVRPLVRLRPGTRYAVGVRDTVVDIDGEPLQRSPGFEALLDGDDVDHPRFAAVAAGSDAMFGALEEAGMPKDEIVLAWDFVTGSDENLTSDLLAMRAAALPAIGDVGANLGFTLEPVADPGPRVYQAFVGSFDTPNFLTDGESKNTRIARDDAGVPALDGLGTARLSILVPACVATAPLPLEVVVFGHGLFGSAEGYLTSDFLTDLADDQCFVVVATDWIGLSSRQVSLAAFAANDFNKSNALASMLGQAVINFIALEHLTRGPLAAAPELAYEGTPILDVDRVYYLGASLGGIMGGTFMAYDPTITRGVLGVPGGAWSLLIERSAAWGLLKVAAQAAYDDPYAYQFLISLLTWSFERWDPITTATRVLADPLPDTPAKQLLMYETLNDSLVSNLATETLARTMGIAVTAPSVRAPYGLELSEEPLSSGLTIYDEHPEPTVPTTNVPPEEDNGTHAGVNERAAVMRAALEFLREGTVANACGTVEAPAACDCATGACD